MKEFYSRALVLKREDVGETDVVAHLFTEQYGKIVVRAKSSRKITSKSAAYLQPLRFIQVRFVTPKKESTNGYILMDALWDISLNQTHNHHELIPLIRALDKLIPESNPEPRLWSLLESAFTELHQATNITRVLLQIMGYNPHHALCARCGEKEVDTFIPHQEMFFCKVCASQLPSNEIQLKI